MPPVERQRRVAHLCHRCQCFFISALPQELRLRVRRTPLAIRRPVPRGLSAATSLLTDRGRRSDGQARSSRCAWSECVRALAESWWDLASQDIMLGVAEAELT